MDIQEISSCLHKRSSQFSASLAPACPPFSITIPLNHIITNILYTVLHQKAPQKSILSIYIRKLYSTFQIREYLSLTSHFTTPTPPTYLQKFLKYYLPISDFYSGAPPPADRQMGCCDIFKTESQEVGAWGIYPYDLLRKIWEYVMFVANTLVMWELVFEWVFQVIPTGTWIIPALILDVLSFADIFITRRTGYIDKGMMILDRQAILKHTPMWRQIYGWVYIWPYYVVGVIVKNEFVYLVLMSVKVLRVLRLYESYTLIRTDLVYISTKSKMFTLILFFLTLVHYFTCFAWLLGHEEYKRGVPNNWFEENALKEKSLWEQYFRLFYYMTTTVLSIGYGDIHPFTFGEMLFAIMCELVGVFNYHYIVSNLVAVVTDPSRRQFVSRFKRIYRTFKWRNLPDESLADMLRYYEYIWHRDRNREIFYENAKQLMPLGLQKRIRMAIHLHIFTNSPALSTANVGTLEKMAIAMHPKIFTPGDTLVSAGKMSKSLFFVTQGRIQALTDTGALVNTFDGENSCVLGENSVVNKHPERCTLIAETYVETYEVSKKDFDHIMAADPEFAESVHRSHLHPAH